MWFKKKKKVKSFGNSQFLNRYEDTKIWVFLSAVVPYKGDELSWLKKKKEYKNAMFINQIVIE